MGLVVLDPLVVALAGFVRREGIWLAAGVMALDVTANWVGNWPSLREDPTRLLGPVGLVPITLFGVFVLVTALPMLRVMKTGGKDYGPFGNNGQSVGQVDVSAPGAPGATR